MGGGKSYFICRRAVELCEAIPKNRWYLCRREAVTFKRTTLVTLLEEVRILDRPEWQHHKTEQYFFHRVNGSRIDYGGLGTQDDLDKLKSMELGGGAIDEASEVMEETFKMLLARVGRKSTAQGKEEVWLTSNPEQCWLKKAFVSNPRKGYVFVPALPEDNPFLTAAYIDNLRETYEDTPALLEAYLRGSWDAIEAADQVFRFEDVDSAVKRVLTGDEIRGQVKELGVDVARYGDDTTVITLRQGGKAVVLDRLLKTDTVGVAEAVVRWVGETRASLVKVDDVGLGGGVTDLLKHEGIPTIGIVSNWRSSDPLRYYDYKAEQVWRLRAMLRAGEVDLPDDMELRDQLLSLTYRVFNGRIRIEPKSETKKKLGQSPDTFDSLWIAFAQPPLDNTTEVWEYYEPVDISPF